MQIREIHECATDLLRSASLTAAERLTSLTTPLTERFGLRLSVTSAATAIFIGATGTTAWGITNIEEREAAEASAAAALSDNTDQVVSVIAEEAATAAENLSAAHEAAQAAAEAAEPEEPQPVGGLDEAQMANAIAIIEAGRDKGFDRDGWVVALATAMQESKFKNYANVNVPASYDYAYQAEGSDHDSVGLFQQRPSSGWGSVKELMDPKTSASKFYGSLGKVKGWKDMPVTEAAQAVQISAFPDHYAQWEDLAWQIVEEYERVQ
ncbi:hypothetical protein GCM10027447_38720 [Glycomyces halotolerans]